MAESDAAGAANDSGESAETTEAPDYETQITALEKNYEILEQKYTAETSEFKKQLEELTANNGKLKDLADKSKVIGSAFLRKGIDFDDELNHVTIEYNEDGSIKNSSYRAPRLVRNRPMNSSPADGDANTKAINPNQPKSIPVTHNNPNVI